MKAITTKFHGPTNHRGARYSASDSDGNKVSIAYDYDARRGGGNIVAAIALVEKMKWNPVILAHGWAKAGDVFVMIPVSEKTKAACDGEFLTFVP